MPIPSRPASGTAVRVAAVTETEPDAEATADPVAEPAGERPWVGRVVLYGLPCFMALCVFAGLNYWPFTTAELFSRVRTNTQREVQVRGDLADGTTVRIDETVQLYHTPGLPQREITPSLCARWAEAGEAQYGEPLTDIRAYRVVNHLTRTDDTVEKRIVSEKPAWSCTP